MKNKTREELQEVLRNDDFLNSLISETKDSIFTPTDKKLTGGAIIDILEGRKPNDYDFISFSESELDRLGFEFVHETRTAKTYKGKKGVKVQVLKTSIEDFDFTISQSIYSIRNKKTEKDLKIDITSFNMKTLIPCEKSWFVKRNAMASLYRIPHYKKKGYTIEDITYHSLLSVINSGTQKNS